MDCNGEENLCRLCLKCLKDSQNSFSLFHFKNGHLIADLIRVICPITIHRSDQFTKKVCSECLELVVDAIHLRDLSLINEQEMRRIKQEKNEVRFTVIEFCKEEESEETFETIEALEEATLDEVTGETFHGNMREDSDEEREPEPARRNYCELCDTSFSNSSSFKRHQLRKHGTAQYQCDMCESAFRTRHDTDVHMKKRHLNKHPDVKFLYSERISIDVTDMYEKLDEPEAMTCTFCAYTDFDEQSLNDHLHTHLDVVNSGKMYCNICPSPIPTMDFMREHTRIHNEKIKTHRCLVCQKTFHFDERFFNHLRNHKKNQHKICFCPNCGRKFSKPRLLEDHIRFIHNKESLFCCPECGQGFGSKSALNGHIKRHMEGQKYHCPFCPKKFSSHNLLNSHKVVHSADRPFSCTLCDKKFKHQKVLADHMKRHGSERPVFICTICERSLNSAYALTRHMLTHTGSKPHQCEYCQKAYAQKNDLNKHLRTHVGENTYSCDFPGCEESFRVLSEMRIHQGVHYIKSSENTQYSNSL